MDYSLLFKLVNAVVLPAWIVMIFFPKVTWRNPFVYALAMLLALSYAIFLFSSIGDLDPQGFTELEGLKAMFTSDIAVLTGWVHYLVFDMLVGNWVVNNAQKHGIKHYLIIPCLFFCFMLGPIGYLLYTIVKLVTVKTLHD